LGNFSCARYPCTGRHGPPQIGVSSANSKGARPTSGVLIIPAVRSTKFRDEVGAGTRVCALMELHASGLRVEGAGLGFEIWTLGSGIQGIHLAHEAAARQMATHSHTLTHTHTHSHGRRGCAPAHPRHLAFVAAGFRGVK
jgi:hypothetical protein